MPGRRPPQADLHEQEIIARAQQGDVDAFAELVRRHQDPVFSLLVRWLTSRASAEDVFQEAMLAAFRNLRRFEPRGSFRAWLFRIAVNKAKDHIRTRKRHDRDERDRPHQRPMEDATSAQVSRLQTTAVLESALATLSRADRLLLLLRFGEQLTTAEVAAATGAPEVVVKMRIHRARRRFRKAAAAIDAELVDD